MNSAANRPGSRHSVASSQFMISRKPPKARIRIVAMMIPNRGSIENRVSTAFLPPRCFAISREALHKRMSEANR